MYLFKIMKTRTRMKLQILFVVILTSALLSVYILNTEPTAQTVWSYITKFFSVIIDSGILLTGVACVEECCQAVESDI